MKWTAKFDRSGFVSIEPDTPQTRQELAETMSDFHAGRLQPTSGQLRIVPLTQDVPDREKH